MAKRDLAVEDKTPSARALPGGRGAMIGLALLTAFGVATWTLSTGGGVITEVQPGLPPRDAVVTWLVPLLKLVNDLAAAVAVGGLLAAAFFVDGTDGKIGPRAYRWSRISGWVAIGWAATALLQAAANLADITAQPLSFVTPANLVGFVFDTENGVAFGLTFLLASLAGIIALNALSVNGAAWATVIALGATVPQVFTGHAAASGNHQLAVDSMLFHVIGAVAWTGGLLALLLARKVASAAAQRYSRLALVAFIAVGMSGVINAAIRLNGWSDLWNLAYGREVIAKTVALLVLGLFGYWHRRVTLPTLETHPGKFRRFAAVEIIVMAATFGLAVALSRTPSPEGEAPENSAQALLGFAMPEPLTAERLMLDWYPNLIVCVMAVLAVGLYLAGVRRLRARGDSWPLSRTGMWLVGWAAAVFVTSSGMAKYGMVLFSVHMAQHMTLNMLVPILLVLAAPVTLALRALRPARERGPREWLLAILHSRVVRFVSHPLIALGIYAFSLYLMYFSALFEWGMRSHAGHLYMVFHFLAAGSLFYWLIIGPDPSPRRIPYPAKILLYFIAIVFHTIFGLTIMQSSDVIAAGWYEALGRDWGASLMDDQHAGGGIAWAFGEPPSLIVLGALVWQWSRSEDRAGKRVDRASDRAQAAGKPDEDPHEQYNAYLAELAESDRKAGLRD